MELRNAGSARVANGEAIEVTDRGRPVARLVPVPSGESALAELLSSGRLKPPENDTDFEAPGDIGIDVTDRLDEMRSDER